MDTALYALNLRKAASYFRETVVFSDIVRLYVPELRQTGSSGYICKCPFHDDDNPSLSLTDAKNLFNCFACGASGTIIKFIKDIEHLETDEAAVIRILQLANLPTDESQWNITTSSGDDYVRTASTSSTDTAHVTLTAHSSRTSDPVPLDPEAELKRQEMKRDMLRALKEANDFYVRRLVTVSASRCYRYH